MKEKDLQRIARCRFVKILRANDPIRNVHTGTMAIVARFVSIHAYLYEHVQRFKRTKKKK